MNDPKNSFKFLATGCHCGFEDQLAWFWFFALRGQVLKLVVHSSILGRSLEEFLPAPWNLPNGFGHNLITSISVDQCIWDWAKKLLQQYRRATRTLRLLQRSWDITILETEFWFNLSTPYGPYGKNALQGVSKARGALDVPRHCTCSISVDATHLPAEMSPSPSFPEAPTDVLKRGSELIDGLFHYTTSPSIRALQICNMLPVRSPKISQYTLQKRGTERPRECQSELRIMNSDIPFSSSTSKRTSPTCTKPVLCAGPAVAKDMSEGKGVYVFVLKMDSSHIR